MIRSPENTVRALVADDDHEQREALADLLASWGVAVEVAADGHECFARLIEGRAHLVLLDMHMPKWTGHEILKAAAVTPGLNPIIVGMSGDESALARARLIGGSLVLALHKPIIVEELRNIIHAVGGDRLR